MRRFEVLTLFPGLFGPFVAEGLIGRAHDQGLVAIEAIDLRPFGIGKHRAVDGEPYGGGAGMVMRPEPVYEAVRSRGAAAENETLRRILVTPQGRPFDQAKARELAGRPENLLFICGRYEGFDERIRALADEEISGGDYIALGGEVVAMAIIESVTRLIPGVLGNPRSIEEASFSGDGLAGGLEYPQYTRPAEFEGMRVPEVLVSGNHEAIARWRKEQAALRTRQRRPELADAHEDKPEGL